jgi:hypothetical protein
VRDPAERVVAVRVPNAEHIAAARGEHAADLPIGLVFIREEHHADLAYDVTRALRDALPAHAQLTLTATDLNADMLEIARAKFRSNEQVAFQPVDATTLSFPDASFDAMPVPEAVSDTLDGAWEAIRCAMSAA